MAFFSALRSRIGSAIAGRPVSSSGGWYPVVRESFTGAWQQNVELRVETALSNPTVFRCVSLIAGDIAKTPLRLVRLTDDGIWIETASPAFSPVLRKPNHYQTISQFLEQWVFSRLLYGNTYVLKGRDDRGVVVALYVLDPTGVTPLVAPDGSIYYEIKRSDLVGLPEGELAVPARDIIHDRWNCAFHPLIGLSPLYACGGAALEANTIQSQSTEFFAKGGRPSGLLIAPTEIDPKTAQRLSETWHSLGPGKTAVVGFGMKYQDIGTTAVDSQLAEQRDGTVATIAGCFGVPVSYVDSSKQPPYANSEATQLQFQAQCLQVHMTAIEAALDEGLALPMPYGTEFDIDALIWMDTATKTAAARDGINAGALAPNEARFKYFNLEPVKGGETPFLQQQYWPLSQLAERDIPVPVGPASPAPNQNQQTVDEDVTVN
jgi:HK97 family phage portal protein